MARRRPGGRVVDADAAEELFKGVYPRLAGWVRRLDEPDPRPLAQDGKADLFAARARLKTALGERDGHSWGGQAGWTLGVVT